MVTALSLLYRRFALGARLRVCLDPIDVLAVRLFLLVPGADLAAVRRQVVLLTAEDAERVPALALDALDVGGRRDLCQVVAALDWAPLYPVVSVGELATVPLQVFRQIRKLCCVLHHGYEERVRYDDVAARLLALGEDAGLAT